jgi:hypothetical protein
MAQHGLDMALPARHGVDVGGPGRDMPLRR